MFEVGKLYKGNYDRVKYLCLGAGKEFAIMHSFKDNREYVNRPSDFENFTEVKTHKDKFYVNFFRNSNSELPIPSPYVFRSRVLADEYANESEKTSTYKRIACLKINAEFEEGQFDD